MQRSWLIWLLIAGLSPALVSAQSSTQVRFRNVGYQTVNVVTDVGPTPVRSNFTLAPAGTHFVNVGNNSLRWCSYKGNNPPCNPTSVVGGGGQVDVN